jgi:hypothetical protein
MEYAPDAEVEGQGKILKVKGQIYSQFCVCSLKPMKYLLSNLA